MSINLTWTDGEKVVNYTDASVYGQVTIDDKLVPIHKFLAYNQQVMEQFKIKYVRDWLKWWIENRNTILANDPYEEVKYLFSRYFGIPTRELVREAETYESLKNWLQGSLVQKPITLTKEPDNPRHESFILVNMGRAQEEVVTHAFFDVNHLGISYRTQRTVSETPTLSLPDFWTERLNYSYRMNESDAKFFRKTNRDTDEEVMFGMELEVSTKLSMREIQYIVTEVEPKQEPFFIGKQDGSINGKYGNYIELVTVPCTPGYLRREWRTFFSKLDSLARSKGHTIGDYFDTSRQLNNGLHIHVSRNKFFGYEDLRNKSIHMRKFITVFNSDDSNTKSLVQQFTGRPTKYYENQYCKPGQEIKGLSLVRRLRGRDLVVGKYSSCNEKNTHTVEVRVYQGIFDIDHIIRCIEFTRAVFNFCAEMSHRMHGLQFKYNFQDWLFKQNGYRPVKMELKQCA